MKTGRPLMTLEEATNRPFPIRTTSTKASGEITIPSALARMMQERNAHWQFQIVDEGVLLIPWKHRTIPQPKWALQAKEDSIEAL